jgi:lipopolysaccharide transport system permease protein
MISAPPFKPVPTILIKGRSRGWSSLGLRDLWQYRELLYYLVWREIQGVYRQTALGLSWVFLRPLLNMLILTMVFGRIVRVPSDGVPYPLFSLAALVPWTYFSNSVTRSARSLVDNMHLISKVYFPRMVIPVAGTFSGMVDFAASLLVLLGALLYYRMPLRPEMLWVPFLTLAVVAFALAAGLWLATLSVKYRDVSFAVTFLLQALMYASPIIYPVSLVPAPLQFLYNLNPMAAVIQGFRWAILGTGGQPGTAFWLSIGVIAAALVSGAYVFRRTERTVVDIL